MTDAQRIVNHLLEAEGANPSFRRAFRPQDHSLTYPNSDYLPSCPKCHSLRVDFPSHPDDAFDCMDCDHSWMPTPKQVAKMKAGRKVDPFYGRIKQ